jgi:hypothetical protein
LTHPGPRILDPGSRIPDPKTATKERDGKKFVATNFTKFKINYLIFFEMLNKKFGPIFKEL